MARRPDYIERKIDFQLQRQRHAREALPGCVCPFCLKDGDVLRTIQARIEAERAAAPPVPF
jgi:hypothetical protein